MRLIDADMLTDWIAPFLLAKEDIPSALVLGLIDACPTIQQPAWISCAERLPTETGMYRVCHKSKLIADRYFYSDAPEIFTKFGNDPVTHWKPIEEPPKEDE